MRYFSSLVSLLALVIGAVVGTSFADLGSNRAAIAGSSPAPGSDTSLSAIAAWKDGRYQLCTQPDPKDWRDGAGICAVLSKMGSRMDGYYGYPHSDRFICLRGSVTNSVFQGEALAMNWVESASPSFARLEKSWDAEDRIQVSQPKLLRTEQAEEGWIAWVRFQVATLNLKGLYRYAVPKMRPGAELCAW